MDVPLSRVIDDYSLLWMLNVSE